MPQEVAHRNGVHRDWLLSSDLVLYTRTHNDTALTPEWTRTWRMLEAAGVQTAAVHLDVFVGVGRAHMERGMDGLRKEPMFTMGTVFTPDPLLAEYITTEHTRHVWLPPAADVRDGDPEGESLPGLEGKIVFVGSLYGTRALHPEYQWRYTLLKSLHAHYGDDFVWFGNGGDYPGRRGKELWDVYESDCIIVGDSCFAGERPYYWSDRVPETIAHGGQLVTPAIEGMEAFPLAYLYEPQNFESLTERILDVTVMSAQARRLNRETAKRTARRHDTYIQRAQTILNTLGLA